MKAHYNTADGRIGFEITGDTVKALFKEIAAIQEVFDAESSCGCCGKTNLRFLARKVDKFDFYELACQDCHARFAFGQNLEGGALFPKRKDKDGEWLPNRGWAKFQPKTEAVGNGKAKVERKDGVAVFLDWETAENSPAWSEPWLIVSGEKYKLVNGAYKKQAA